MNDGAHIPNTGMVRVIAVCTSAPLVGQGSRCDDLQFPQAAGDLAGTVAFGGKLEDQPDDWGCFGVYGQIALRVPQIAIGGLGGETLAAHALGLEHGPYLLAG